MLGEAKIEGYMDLYGVLFIIAVLVILMFSIVLISLVCFYLSKIYTVGKAKGTEYKRLLRSYSSRWHVQ